MKINKILNKVLNFLEKNKIAVATGCGVITVTTAGGFGAYAYNRARQPREPKAAEPLTRDTKDIVNVNKKENKTKKEEVKQEELRDPIIDNLWVNSLEYLPIDIDLFLLGCN